jgi:hypothetical protein
VFDLPKKTNLRILTVNCRSIAEKTSEFRASLDYIRPDIICGTESWLSGVKPGQPPTRNAILSSEVFPSHYRAYRNDRSSKGGGVFVLVHQDIIASEQPEHVTSCEIVWVKIKLKSSKDLVIGSFYMPHRNMNDVTELDKSLTSVMGG